MRDASVAPAQILEGTSPAVCRREDEVLRRVGLLLAHIGSLWHFMAYVTKVNCLIHYLCFNSTGHKGGCSCCYFLWVCVDKRHPSALTREGNGWHWPQYGTIDCAVQQEKESSSKSTAVVFCDELNVHKKLTQTLLYTLVMVDDTRADHKTKTIWANTK